MTRRASFVLAAAAGVLATALVGGIASAAIPGPSGVIQGCYDSGGNVKVVEALPCPPKYTPFQWNQQGLQGAKGDKGDRGLNGAGAPKSWLVVGDSTPSVAGCTLLQLDGSGDPGGQRLSPLSNQRQRRPISTQR